MCNQDHQLWNNCTQMAITKGSTWLADCGREQPHFHLTRWLFRVAQLLPAEHTGRGGGPRPRPSPSQCRHREAARWSPWQQRGPVRWVPLRRWSTSSRTAWRGSAPPASQSQRATASSAPDEYSGQMRREEEARRVERWRMQVCGHSSCVWELNALVLAHQSNLHRDGWHPESYEHKTQPSEQVPSRVPRLARNKPLWQDIWKLFHSLQWEIGAQWTISRYLFILKMKHI